MAISVPEQTALLPASPEEIAFMERRVMQTFATLEQTSAMRARAQSAETKAKKEHYKACRALRQAQYPDLVADEDDDGDTDDD